MDYHAVRGRNPAIATHERFEGETEFDSVRNSRSQQMQKYGKLWSGDAHLLWDGAINEALVVDEILARVSADHGQFSTVVRAIVQSQPFRYQPRDPVPADERELR